MQTVIGLFENAHDAQQAVQHLLRSGFSSDNVDVSVKGSNTTSGNYSSENYASGDTSGNTLTGTSNTSVGSTSGSSFGSTSDSTYQSSDDSLSNRTLSGDDDNNRTYRNDNDDDSFGDKVSRFFKNLFGGDNDDADRYTHVANKTGSIVTVYAQSNDEAERAADILDENGAVNVDERASEYGYSGRSTSSAYSSDTLSEDDSVTNTSNYSSDRLDTDDNDNDTLNVIKEDVQIGKREVETGGVRLRSRIVERPVEETIRLREEKVTVERNPVDRPATTSDFQNFKEGEIEMTERAEVADVTKQARVVEEIKLTKEVNERTETISETARDTEVDVENLSSSDATTKKNKKKDY
jgi:uncharacterized protein (TIGR02271 family)